MSEEGKCPARIHHAYSMRSSPCGRPVKRNGLCGIHAAAEDKRKAGDEKRAKRLERDRALTVGIKAATGMSVYVNRRPYGEYVEVRLPDFLAFLERQGIPVDTEGES